jgi:hypothetical protein
MEKPMIVENADPRVQQVWDHWLTVVHGTKPGLTPALSPKRDLAIRKALKVYPVEVCLKAIDGIMLSPFHLGKNNRKKTYTDITLILRDAEHIERFVALVDGQSTVDDARNEFLSEAW